MSFAALGHLRNRVRRLFAASSDVPGDPRSRVLSLALRQRKRPWLTDYFRRRLDLTLPP